MKHFDSIKAAAILDTFFITFLLFIAGCMIYLFAFAPRDEEVSIIMLILSGLILGIVGGAYNYYHWMKNGRGAFRPLVQY